MDQEQMARVTELMGRMAAGDGVAAGITLVQECAGQVRAAIRRAAALRGVDLRPPEVDDLLTDVALVLNDLAGAWRPDGGALPWVWAEHRIRNVVDRSLGLFAQELDDARIARADQEVERRGGEPVAIGAEPALPVVLAGLAQRHPSVRVLRDALAQVASPRDAELWLEIRAQEAAGDRAAAATVAPRFAMSADAARQQRRRIEQRLRHLRASDARYAGLDQVVGLEQPLSTVA